MMCSSFQLKFKKLLQEPALSFPVSIQRGTDGSQIHSALLTFGLRYKNNSARVFHSNFRRNTHLKMRLDTQKKRILQADGRW